MGKFFSSLVLGAALLAPVAIEAEDHRYYDRDHKDYHAWNDGENRAYSKYLEERHEERKRDFSRENKNKQREYWKWRHDHSDAVLFPH